MEESSDALIKMLLQMLFLLQWCKSVSIGSGFGPQTSVELYQVDLGFLQNSINE